VSWKSYNVGLEMSAIVTGIRERLEAILAAPQGRYRPFVVDDAAVGWIDDLRAHRLEQFADVLVVDKDRVRFVDDLATPQLRTDAMERVARQLSAEGALSAWRDERYAVVRKFGDDACFDLERSAARYFGIRTFAAHINGLVHTAAGVLTWLGRRSPHKAIDAGLLDNMVGGGIAAGASVAATVVKEAWEEAGIPAAVATLAQPAGTVRICRAHPRGLERETVYVHDLWLDADFMPKGVDGEVVEFRCESLAAAARLAANREGADVLTADASLVLVDCLIRHAAIIDGSDDFAVLDALRRVSLEPANCA
jgi:8-oxo-dGTP pyrophosphatase MutT (NUDIX family)